MRALLLLMMLLSVPSIASAAEGDATVVPRRDATKPGCGDAGQPAAIAQLEADRDALDGPNPPWRRLLKAGRSGCGVVADWLDRGAPGSGVKGVEKAIAALAARGHQDHLVVMWGLFGERSDRVDVALVEALGTRLVELGDHDAAKIADHPSAKVRHAALPLLVGHFSAGRWETVYGRPIWRESKLFVAPTGPSTAHVEAVRGVLQEGRFKGEGASRFVDLAGRLLEEGAPGAEAWVELVLPLVELAGPGDQDTANRAARALAWGAQDAAAPLTILVEDRRKEAVSHYLDGLAARLRARDDLDATLAALDAVAQADLGPASARAARMHATWSRKRA